MTGKSAAFDCPAPPADLYSRKIPARDLNLTTFRLLRIHWTKFDARFFNRRSTSKSTYRFDAPNDEYGVLYASTDFEVCMAETVIRDRFQTGPLVIDTWELDERSVTQLAVVDRDTLRLVDLSAPLFSIGGSIQIMADPDYTRPNLWSKAFHDHPDKFDGLYFSSRFSNGPSIALFDHVELNSVRTWKLTDYPELAPLLDKYEIAVI